MLKLTKLIFREGTRPGGGGVNLWLARRNFHSVWLCIRYTNLEKFTYA